MHPLLAMVITQTVFSGFESILAPVEAKKNDAAGIVACNKKNLAMQMQSQSDGTSKSNNHAPLPTCHTPNLRCFALGSAGSGSASVTGLSLASNRKGASAVAALSGTQGGEGGASSSLSSEHPVGSQLKNLLSG